MFSSMPRWNRIWIRATLTLAWLLVAAAGVAMWFDTPMTIVREVGETVTDSAGLAMAAAALVAAIGVCFDRYRLEWAASWFAATAIVPYVITVWWLVFTESGSRTTQAFFMSALLVLITLRAQFCAAHAAKLRTMHEETTGSIHVGG